MVARLSACFAACLLLSCASAVTSLELGPITCTDGAVLDGVVDSSLRGTTRDIIVPEGFTCTISGVITTGSVTLHSDSTLIFQASSDGVNTQVESIQGTGAAAVIAQNVELTGYDGLHLANAKQVHLTDSVVVMGNIIMEGSEVFSASGVTIHGRMVLEHPSRVSLFQLWLHGALSIRNSQGDVTIGDASLMESEVTIEGGVGPTQIQDSEIRGSLSVSALTGKLTLLRSSFLEDLDLRNTTGNVEVLHSQVGLFTAITRVKGFVFFRDNHILGDTFIGEIEGSVFLESNEFHGRRFEGNDIVGVLDILLNKNVNLSLARNKAVSIQDSTVLEAILFKSDMGFKLEDNTFISLACLENGSANMARNSVSGDSSGQCAGAGLPGSTGL